MRLYRFSPIKSEAELAEAIAYVHDAAHKLCYQTIGKYLPISGGVGIFCHYFEEFEYLTKLRSEITTNLHFNGKYFELKTPVYIPEKNGVPAGTYEFLYIRKVDPYRSQVGDIDFVMSREEHHAFKEKLVVDDFRQNARIFGRAEDNMIELWNPDRDVMSYLVAGNLRSKL